MDRKRRFAVGVPGKIRFICQPKRGIYNLDGTIVKTLEPEVCSAFYFDSPTGRRFKQGAGSAPSKENNSPRLPSPQDWGWFSKTTKRSGNNRIK